MRITVELDTNSRGTRILFAVGLVAVPLAAMAGTVDIPNTFQAGDPITAAEMNENFAAIEVAVDDNASATNLKQCTWVTDYRTDIQSVTVDCPTDTFAVSGYCSKPPLAADATLYNSAPTGVILLATGGNVDPTEADGWQCSQDANSNMYIGALCCPM